ncbi:cysteine--tRNA ligase [Papillibacter cinnamivorans]|uniref:Cysteine--tRNA ligase n=1 Tax=Papillibacter cinnamivorans DSM 12816 TaxID=1122930 RepID=A0A1W1ZJH0_9FIRM|nr:cysteine--tRNA ligase [Papillibacter cinnamivorans]SMC48181.1 cysteinyl-tRNA synthetase [Papillibacter cinnamivorans DSM 12816]
MKIYNTLTRKKEEFVPITKGEVKIYTCGPTVYNFIHVGNARPIILFDTFRRYLEYRGYKVTFVQNFTDVDDKVIGKANEEGTTYDKIAERYIGEYFADAHGLGVRDADIHPKATENIEEIIAFIQGLIDKGYAYVSEGDVYYSTEQFPEYGKLSHQPLEDLEAGARVGVSESKRAPMDFALWKAAKPGEPAWDAPWGRGRPGWHIECSVMAGRYLGETIDIHCGGQDLIFPHHENEIAQSEAHNGCDFVHYWMHNGFLSIDNRKMSKSLGNFFTVREAAGAYGYETIRMFMLSAHYRSPLNYSEESLMQAKAALDRLYTAADNLKFLSETAPDLPKTPEETAFTDTFGGYRARFIDAMDDDFNTADAVSVLFELVRAANAATAQENKPTRGFAAECLAMVRELADVLGLLYGRNENSLDDEVEALIEARQAARKAKNFREADRIRDQLKEMGILLEDTPQGVKWKKA